MTTPGKDVVQERTYGLWRLGRRPGLWGLDPIGTVIAFGFMVVAAALVAFAPLAAVAVVALGVLVLAPLMVRVHGRTGMQVVTAWIVWWLGARRRRNLYLSGIASPLTATQQLPGVLARSQLYTVETGRIGLIGVVVIPQTGHYTVSLTCETDGMDLVDRAVVDARVARLAQWLSSLCREPMLAQAAITVETTPDPGTRLAEEIAATTRPDAPPLARQVLAEVAASYPAGSARVETRVSLTFSKPPGREWTPEVMCREVAARLPHLHAGLTGAGVSAIRPMTARDLVAAVRAAYDPDAAVDLSGAGIARLSGLDWDQAGPVAAREAWSSYTHDGVVSRTWGMVEAPRGAVFASTFSRLTDPDPGLLRKRVTVLYRPYSPGEAAALVERDRRDARFAASQRARGATARESVDVAAADQSAAEEARGAGIVRFTVLVTATVRAEDDLAEAERVIRARAGEARLALRPMTGAQSASFAALLPAGIVLPAHATLPI